MERVSWEEAVEFAARLMALHPGFTYRLPTELEWEFSRGAGLGNGWDVGFRVVVEPTSDLPN